MVQQRFIGQVLQLHQDCTWTLSHIEKASGSLYKVKGHITNLYKNCNLTKGYMVFHHIIILIQKVLGTHAGSSMALSSPTLQHRLSASH